MQKLARTDFREILKFQKYLPHRHTPFFEGYRPQFYVRTTDVTGKITSFRSDNDAPAQMVIPGDRIKMEVELIQPIAIEKGMRFAIREGGRTVGAGIVLTIIE